MFDKKQGDVVNITSHHQTGGITAHTVNVGARPRMLNAAAQQQLTARVPKSVPVKVHAVLGDGEAYQLAQQIVAFLTDGGYTIVPGGIDQVVLAEPRPGVGIDAQPTLTTIHVGSR